LKTADWPAVKGGRGEQKERKGKERRRKGETKERLTTRTCVGGGDTGLL